jgi:tripartite-type tricarboxylate transporter receptor subunit TctC
MNNINRQTRAPMPSLFRPGMTFCALLFSIAFLSIANAQTFPARSVVFVVPQAPGGATDVFARIMAQKLGARWGQQVVVENRAGAGGIPGTDAVAKAAPDGYTLLVTYEGSQAVNQSLYAKLPFDSVKDFQPVATLAVTPFFLVVGPKSDARDLKDFIATARARPGSMFYASSGNGSINHLLGEMLKSEAGINMVHVPYKGIAAAMADVMGGQVEAAFASVPSVLQNVRSGKLRALAVSSAKRNAAAPEVPSIAESGYPGFDVNPWWGILAPAGTPQAVVDKINADLAAALKTAEVQALFRKQGAETLASTPDAFTRLLEADVLKWAKVVKASGAHLD